MSSTTLATLLADFVKEYAGSIGGRVGIVTANGSPTTVVDATSFGGPFSASEWTRGSPIRFTVGGQAGGKSFLTAYDPATGTLTFSPAVGGTQSIGDTFIIVQKHIVDSIDRLIEAANRGLRRHCTRWLKTPLTEIPGGDLLGSAADWATQFGQTATITYVDQAVPEGFYQRFVRFIPTSAMTAYLTRANSLTKMQVKPGDVVDFQSVCRNIPNAGIPTGWSFVVHNVTANAAIAPSFTQGAASTAITTLTEIACSFTVPAGCYEVDFRFLNTGGTLGTAGIDVGPQIACVRGKLQFTTQPPLDAVPKMIGNFYRRRTTATNEHPAFGVYDQVPLACNPEDLGWGFSLQFQDGRVGLPFPLYYEQLMSYGALTLDTDTTACPEDLALAAMAFEFFTWADRTERRSNQNVFIFRRRISLSRWEQDLERAEAHLKLMMKAYGAEIKIVKRREYQGQASA